MRVAKVKKRACDDGERGGLEQKEPKMLNHETEMGTSAA